MAVKLREQHVFINASRELVFQLLSAMGRGQIPGSGDEGARVLERRGEGYLVVEFHTRAGGKLWRTVEEVRLDPPDRMTFHHLEGPLDYSAEAFELEAQGEGTLLRYSGEFEYRLPVLGPLVRHLYIRPRYNALIREHMERIRQAAEARAARSHVFRRRRSREDPAQS